MRIRIGIIIILSLIVFKFSMAQENNWQIILSDGNKISCVSSRILTGSSLFIIGSRITRQIPVQSIVKIRIVKKSKFWEGGKIGFFSGATLGALFGMITYDKQKSHNYSEFQFDLSGAVTIFWGITGGLVGFITGGTVGALHGKDIVFDLSGMTLEEKKVVIRKILDKNL